MIGAKRFTGQMPFLPPNLLWKWPIINFACGQWGVWGNIDEEVSLCLPCILGDTIITGCKLTSSPGQMYERDKSDTSYHIFLGYRYSSSSKKWFPFPIPFVYPAVGLLWNADIIIDLWMYYSICISTVSCYIPVKVRFIVWNVQ